MDLKVDDFHQTGVKVISKGLQFTVVDIRDYS